MRVVRLVAVCAAAALVSAAAASAALSPSAYRAQANAVCAKTKAQQNALGQLQGNPPTSDAVKYVATSLQYTQQEYTALYALQPPSSLVAAHRTALWDLWKLNAFTSDALKQMQSGTDWQTALDAHGATKLQLLGDLYKAWAAAGLTVCGSGSISISVHFGK
jgi:hypothetical protein